MLSNEETAKNISGHLHGEDHAETIFVVKEALDAKDALLTLETKRRCEVEAEVKRLQKTVGTSEHVQVLREAFQQDWKANFDKAEGRIASLVKAINYLWEMVCEGRHWPKETQKPKLVEEALGETSR